MAWIRCGMKVLAAGALAAIAACSGGSNSDQRFADSSNGADWPGYGRTFGEQHFSPLDEINAGTVGRLSLAWSLDLPAGNTVSQPIKVDTTLYFVTGQAIVHAVDAATGKPLWEHDPKVGEAAGFKMRYAWGTRGLVWYDGRIYVGTMDGRLIALDAATGKEVWAVQTISKGSRNYITGAPRVFGGKVLIGFGGADVGPARGYVTAYDATSGKQLWQWFTVPGDPAKGFENKAMAMAAKTWAGEWWKLGGGGTVWNAMSYDPETDTVFLGTGNGSPWNHKARSDGKGDNLFLASIVALDGRTGSYKWHYQVNPGETWDYTATNDMALATLKTGGKPRKVLITAPKNGFLYVLDRTNGKLISAEPFAKITWASRIDLATGRPVESPEARYPAGSTAVVWPSDRGAHNWSPMAYSPQSRLAYIPVNEKAGSWADYGLAGAAWRKDMPVGDLQTAAMFDLYPKTGDPLDGTSKLLAFDVVNGRIAWSQPTPGPLGGGVMASGGNLVFQGRLDGRFNAYQADNGHLLWSFDAHAPVQAPPISYSVGGRQYVTVLSGAGTGVAFIGPPMARLAMDYRTQPRRVLTFALDGNAPLPGAKPAALAPFADPGFKADATQLPRGYFLFATRCLMCHGVDAVGAGAAPDLRASPVPLEQAAFAQVVEGGGLVAAGMPRFTDISDADLAAIRQYIRSRAAAWRAQGAGK